MPAHSHQGLFASPSNTLPSSANGHLFFLSSEDFRNDKVDAGEIGAGHSVTALYEVTLAGTDSGRFAPLRYQSNTAQKAESRDTGRLDIGTEMAFLRMRYKAPGGAQSKLVVTPIAAPGQADDGHFGRFKLAAAVAGFGQLLRDGRYIQAFGFDDVMQLATDADVPDKDGYIAEFRQLASVAKALVGHQNLQSRASAN
jgi:Ca-activated chloride channel homolog